MFIVNTPRIQAKSYSTSTPTKINLLDENFPVKSVVDSTGEKRSLKDLFENKKVVVFGLPGAYTPVCHSSHVPSYLKNVDALKEKGVDSVLCVSVNDKFVMKNWGESLGVDGKLTLIADWNANFVKSIGKEIDLSGACLGLRSKRFSLIVNNGVVEKENVEITPAEFDVTSAEVIISQLNAEPKE